MQPLPRAIAACLLTGLTTNACNLSIVNDDCETDQIVARFDGTFTAGGSELEVHREDPLAPANLSPEAFRQVNGVLLEGGAPVGGVVWNHGGIGTANDFFAIAMGAPLRDGQIRAVSSTFEGGGWGPFDVGGRAASFALRLGDAWATNVHGEFTVVEATPLNLEVVLDITLSDGASARLVGSDTFRYVRGTCKDARR